MTCLRFEQWVPFPIQRVFAFFANPDNLPRIMPPGTCTKIVELKLNPPLSDSSKHFDLSKHFAGSGSEISTSFRPVPFLPFRQKWIALITEFEWQHHFADIQQQGPFKTWHHRHEFSAEMRGGITGTVVRDIINYEIGFGLVGNLADKLVVRRSFNRMFGHRQRTLQTLLQE